MVLLEICVDTLAGVDAAVEHGGQRIELCGALGCGGVTPSPGLMARARRATDLPIAVLVRPRSGSFTFDALEVEQMLADVEAVVAGGFDGVVVGALGPDGRLERQVLARLRETAAGLPVVCHRAFDQVPDPEEALETLVDLGFDRVLTSGGAATAMAGMGSLRALVQQAAGRIEILAGGGVRRENASELVRGTGVDQVHSAARRGAGTDPEEIAALAQVIAELDGP